MNSHSDTCNFLRRRALKHGEGSAEYDVWVRHSRHCQECQNELYILGLLKADSRGDGSHLSPENVSRLVQLADHRYRGHSRRGYRIMVRVWGWSWRVAGFAALLFVLLNVLPAEWTGYHSQWGGGHAAEQSLPELGGSSPAVLGAASEKPSDFLEVAHPEKLEEAEAFSMEPEILSGWEIDQAIHDARTRMERQQNAMQDHMEQDGAGEWW